MRSTRASGDRRVRHRGEACGTAPKKVRSARTRLTQGDCIEVMRTMTPASVDCVVTDPPYGIDFKGEHWDGRAIDQAAARWGNGHIGRGGAFEFWTRDWAETCLGVMKPGAHLVAFGSPRTFHRLVGGIEDAGLEIRDTLMWLYGTGMPKSRRYPGDRATGLKPAFEPIVLARRPLVGTVEENVARYGTGLLGVGDCRVGDRHPADVIVSHEQDCGPAGCAPGCAAASLDECAGRTRIESGPRISPSRFFYCPKASRVERDAGCGGLPRRELDIFPNAGGARRARAARNTHPTVKPLELMRWLVRLACPPGGLVLDPFTGSGSTGAATLSEGRRFCGIESEQDYIEVATARIAHWAASGTGGSSTGHSSTRARR